MSDKHAIEKLVYTIENMMALTGYSRPTINRKCTDTRQGRDDFILPFTKKGHRVLWLASAVHEWINAKQYAAQLPVNAPTNTKQRRKQEREFKERQQKAAERLLHHQKRKMKGGQES
jgi:predicted DNA-binding transcriptional regulator AlpA